MGQYMSRRARSCAAAIVAVATLGVAGCGSDDSSSDGGGGAGPAVQGQKPKQASLKGDPIVLADISDVTGVTAGDLDDFQKGAKAGSDYINNELGGVDGRPFKVVACDSKFEPAATANCANRAIEAKAVVAIGLSLLLVNNGSQALHRVGIATMNAPNTPPDFADAMSFPLGGGGKAETPALAYYAATSLKAKKVAAILPDNPAGHGFAKVISATLKAQGVTNFTPAFLVNTATDVNPVVVNAIRGHPDYVLSLNTGPTAIRVYQALGQQGYPGDKILSGGSLLNSKFLDAAASTFDGVRLVPEFQNPDDLSNPDVKTYRQAMATYAPSENARVEFMQWGFANAMMVYQAAKAVGGEGFDAKAFAKFMTDGVKAKAGLKIFMGPTLSDSNAVAGAPAIRNSAVQVVQYKDKKFTTESHGFFVAPENAGSAGS